MKRYGNLSGDSGVIAYEIHADTIAVQFSGGEVYWYTRLSAGVEHLERMKALARAGRGLSTYISRHVRDGFSHKTI